MHDVNLFSQQVTELLDTGKYNDAKKKLLQALNTADEDDDDYPMLLAEVAGFLIDIGSESLDYQAAKAGTDTLLNNEEFFKEVFSDQSYHYCLANGMNALYKIQMHGKGLPIIEEATPFLIESKKHYFKAFKNINLKDLNEPDLPIIEPRKQPN